MSPWLILAGLVGAAAAALLFSTVSYALRDVSRARLSDALERRGRSDALDPTLEYAGDLIFLTAVFRMLANIMSLRSSGYCLRSAAALSCPIGAAERSPAPSSMDAKLSRRDSCSATSFRIRRKPSREPPASCCISAVLRMHHSSRKVSWSLASIAL